jgi:hypothetical protein
MVDVRIRVTPSILLEEISLIVILLLLVIMQVEEDKWDFSSQVTWN